MEGEGGNRESTPPPPTEQRYQRPDKSSSYENKG
jgi:hypothetical protein